MQHRSTNGSLYILHIHVYVSKGIHKYVKSDACIGLCINSICMSISRCKYYRISCLRIIYNGISQYYLFPFCGKTTQSARWCKAGTSTAFRTRTSPGCRHGFLATTTSPSKIKLLGFELLVRNIWEKSLESCLLEREI